MREWHGCRCKRQHPTARGFLKCKLGPRLAWCIGSGNYALIAWCGSVTISLWPDRARALDAENLLHATGCRTDCRQAHELVYINHQRKVLA